MKEHEVEVRVRYSETDAMGIVYHTNYIIWFEIGRTEFLRDLGYAYSDFEKDGFMLPLSECTCKYKVPAVYDDVLIIKTKVAELKGASVVMAYEIVKKETGETVVTGTTKHAVTNMDLKPVRLKTACERMYNIFSQE